MIIRRFRPLSGCSELENVKDDFGKSRRLEKYRLGKAALYLPAGFVWDYLPLSDISDIRCVTRLIQSENGVCPFAMEVRSVRLFFGGRDIVLETEKEKSADAMLAAVEAVKNNP